MREKDITPEVIRLSKEIAELWKKEIYVGCWAVLGKKVFLINAENLFALRRSDEVGFLIPEIDDCLEKLRERYTLLPEYVNQQGFDNSLLNIFKNYIERKATVEEVHRWLLSALLEVLKEE